ncbi:MAG: twin-arginine translocation signal domain-containing protein [Mucispirillum sp.]|nr:twin-arginine translocation signal domain-containing protein [Mucispirillum sp.]
MGKKNNVLKTLQEKSVSRRSFMKGAVALGAMTSAYGCSKDSGSEIIYGGGDCYIRRYNI